MATDPVYEPLPPYAFVPGGPWPHPTSSPEGHSFGQRTDIVAAIDDDDWESSPAFLRGVALFNAGYYWEAHEAWEALWHAHNRRGPTADVLKGLIKLAAAGVKVREGQRHGIMTHARRASALFETALNAGGPWRLGLDLNAWAQMARSIAENPPHDRQNGERVARVFAFRIEPRKRPGS